MKNHWVLLLKNDDLANFVRDAPWVLGREALVLGYNVVLTPRETAEARLELPANRPRRGCEAA